MDCMHVLGGRPEILVVFGKPHEGSLAGWGAGKTGQAGRNSCCRGVANRTGKLCTEVGGFRGILVVAGKSPGDGGTTTAVSRGGRVTW